MKFDELTKQIAQTRANLRCTCHSHNGFILEGLTSADESVRLDKSGSVSGLDSDEENHVFDERLIDEQHRRFLQLEAV